VTGKKENAECGTRNAELHSGIPSTIAAAKLNRFRIPRSAFRNQAGFSLLELMISMFILIILISVAVPTYQRSVQHAKETVLRENLWQMRRAIDQYTADKAKLPQSLDDLVEAKYLREIPMDPVTEKAEWEPVTGEDPNSVDKEQGLVDVKSLSEETDSDGKAYKEY
jgi:general secretion pathway protein G